MGVKYYARTARDLSGSTRQRLCGIFLPGWNTSALGSLCSVCPQLLGPQLSGSSVVSVDDIGYRRLFCGAEQV